MRLIATVGFMWLITLAQPALGHESDRVQLFLRALEVVPAGETSWRVEVTLVDADSGRGAPGMDVTARAARGPAPAAGPVRLDDGGGGRYSGQLVLAPGRWIITIEARAAPGGEPAVPLEQSSTVTLAGTGAGPSVSEAIGIGGGNVAEAGFRWVHTLVAIGWTVGVGLLGLLASPRGRRLLSNHAVTVLDCRLRTIMRTTWFLTGMVVLTGIVQLVKWAPYEIPLTSGRAEELFRLPWAKPYFLALAVKLAAYATLIALSGPLMWEAGRRAAAWVEPGGTPGSDDRVPVWLRLVPAGLVTGAAVLTLTVTLLLYFHRVSEVARFG